MLSYFARYKKYMICLISISKFSDVLSVFNCARAIGNISRIYLGVNILCPFLCFATYLALDTVVI